MYMDWREGQQTSSSRWLNVLQQIMSGNEKLFLNLPLLRLMTSDGNQLQPYQ